MAETTVAGVTEDSRHRSRFLSWSRMRWFAVLLCAVSSIAGVVVGSQQATWYDLQQGLYEGTVDHVEVSGSIESWDREDGVSLEAMDAQASPTLYWRDGWQRYRTDIRQYSTAPANQGEDYSPDWPDFVAYGEIAPTLQEMSPTVAVEHTPMRDGFTVTNTFFELPGPWGLVYLATIIAFLITLGYGPEPWAATRWAWFWLSTTPFTLVVMPLYLLLGAEGARPGRGRLTGGWAFLLSVFVFGGTWFVG